MSGLVCLCIIAITVMLIYGTVKGKTSYLLPFFCLQLFDFAITTLTAAGYLCYIRSVIYFCVYMYYIYERSCGQRL